ncbi:hypothetical protein [Billgrantia bachuensis]|uniref:Uncharacterized protein n=1 Tax=Billgrantia bachuensis TaxID=2717286 RepID=A0ABX0PMY8_9GAMM|nr:hypothetical protein [Halomonas bachuensis]NIC03976.1 hypothetical protein [Halomonas bachuensis]
MFDTSSWSFGTNSADTAGGYNYGGSTSLVEAGRGLFSDALGAWVTIEGIKAQANATGSAQDATRNQTMYPTGSNAPGGGGFAAGGLGAGHLIVGGAVLVGLVLLLK